ncbi:hypothetical protein INR49_016812 [Caranx melampygus]|nr:hypothetical protein INR49_016812 [Caranx melampygus]
MPPAVNMSSIGFDTLEEEEEEKARFFAQLEAGASSAIDYSKLNRELDSTSSTIGANLRNAEEAEEQSDDQSKARVTKTTTRSPGSPHYSMDFEDEESAKESQEEKSKTCPVPGKATHVRRMVVQRWRLFKRPTDRSTLSQTQMTIINITHLWKGKRGSTDPCPRPSLLNMSDGLYILLLLMSQIPTAEELMRPIRLGEAHISGSRSSLALEEKPSHSLEKTFPDVSQSEAEVKQPEKVDDAAVMKGAQGLTSCSPEPPNHYLTWSIREEVERLMEDHKSSSSQASKVKKQQREEEDFLVQKLRIQLAQNEQELRAMREGAEELTSLRQQNYLLQSKLRGAEEAGQRKRLSEATEPATEEKLQQLKKEIKEQETLIKGYQQENEKLYAQMKAQQAKSKANEEAMLNENQWLQSELDFTREQLSKPLRPPGNICLMAHPQRITDLLAQISMFQRNEVKLCEDIHRLKQKNQALEVDLQFTKKERDLAKAQVISTSENQELLDRGAGRLKAATAEIRQLKEQIENLKMEVDKRGNEQQKKAKEKTVEMKKMQNLERQVKELEQILRYKNPNSLPALMYAAASAAEEVATKTPTSLVTLLENRIQRLESELENRDDEAKHSLRAMEQRFHSVKLRYEQQISEMEQQLQQRQQAVVESSAAAGTKPWMSQVQMLEEQLQREKQSHQEKEKSLRQHQHQAEEAFGIQIERLNQDLATKTRTIQELSRTVERLQRERRSMLSVPSPRPESHSAETKRQPGPTKSLCGAARAAVKHTWRHISEVQQENEALQQHLEQLQLQTDQDKEALKAEAAQAKEELCRLKKHSEERLISMQTEQQRVIEQLCATHALEHSSSKAAQQANKINSLEVLVKHLQEQLKELQGVKDTLKISRTRESALQNQLTRLLEELKEAKEAQSPELKLLCSLDKKILNMELRHQHRQKELMQVTDGSWQMLESNQQSEVERWKHLAQDKSRELEAFRLELDSILDILRHLQRQGVKFSGFFDAHVTVEIVQRFKIQDVYCHAQKIRH